MKVNIIAILLLGVGLQLSAQTSDQFNITFNHVALSVSDLVKSASFYKEVLNLSEITNRTEMNGIRWFSLGEDNELHLISTISGKIELNKAVHFAISTPDFEAFVENLENRKIQYQSWAGTINEITVRADGIKQVYIKDPDGYWIEVNSASTI